MVAVLPAEVAPGRPPLDQLVLSCGDVDRCGLLELRLNRFLGGLLLIELFAWVFQLEIKHEVVDGFEIDIHIKAFFH